MTAKVGRDLLASGSHRVYRVPPLPERPEAGHKGMFGRVLVVGGCLDMIGAPVLAGSAALRLGAGLVQVAMPRPVLAAALSVVPELIGLGLRGRASDAELLAACEAADAIVLGPGIGQSAQASALVLRLVRLQKPMVVDADALNILARRAGWPDDFRARAVLTPHPGEMKRLAGMLGIRVDLGDEKGRVSAARASSRVTGQVVVLKGHRTVVSDNTRVYVNRTGDSSLSKAGSGDVLSGMIGCLLAQGMEPFEASLLGVYLHGRAGERAGRLLGRRCVLSGDVINTLPAVVREHERRISVGR